MAVVLVWVFGRKPQNTHNKIGCFLLTHSLTPPHTIKPTARAKLFVPCDISQKEKYEEDSQKTQFFATFNCTLKFYSSLIVLTFLGRFILRKRGGSRRIFSQHLPSMAKKVKEEELVSKKSFYFNLNENNQIKLSAKKAFQIFKELRLFVSFLFKNNKGSSSSNN